MKKIGFVFVLVTQSLWAGKVGSPIDPFILRQIFINEKLNMAGEAINGQRSPSPLRITMMSMCMVLLSRQSQQRSLIEKQSNSSFNISGKPLIKRVKRRSNLSELFFDTQEDGVQSIEKLKKQIVSEAASNKDALQSLTLKPSQKYEELKRLYAVLKSLKPSCKGDRIKIAEFLQEPKNKKAYSQGLALVGHYQKNAPVDLEEKNLYGQFVVLANKFFPPKSPKTVSKKITPRTRKSRPNLIRSK